VLAAVTTPTKVPDVAAGTTAFPTTVAPDAPAVNVIACVEAARFTIVNSNDDPTTSSATYVASSVPVGVVNARPAVGVQVNSLLTNSSAEVKVRAASVTVTGVTDSDAAM
jgi:hypothetical protein